MFKTNHIFCSLINWFSSLWELATTNQLHATVISIFLSGSVFLLDNMFLPNQFFGTTYFVLGLIHITLFGNAFTGAWKNVMKSRVHLALSQLHEPESRDYKVNIKMWKAHKFDLKKIYFVFFKSLSFMMYLFVVKALTMDGYNDDGGIEALEITAEILIRVPIALFWYYEFKSIGENTEYIFGKKAMIFTIAEWIFEPRISRFLGNKFPAGARKDFDIQDYKDKDDETK
jgi:hypothetical protein